jgi:nitrate/TMAO reductase-like tetraheme cytochrome c subunit
MRTFGLFAAAVAIVGLTFVEFVYRKRLARSTYHWLLLMGMVVLPGIVLMSTTVSLLEDTKTVASCASCHVMRPFVQDMRNPESRTLAARHYQTRWIPDQQCYVCHSTYGVHGALDAKLSSIRHWFLYVTGSWQEPISYRGKYPNKNCLACHASAQRFERVSSHVSYMDELRSNQRSCINCHGAPHPAPSERQAKEGQP